MGEKHFRFITWKLTENADVFGFPTVAYFLLAELILLLTQYCAGDKMEKIEMGWACGAYG